MKKFFVLVFAAALFASGLLLSCSNDSEKIVYVQMPATNETGGDQTNAPTGTETSGGLPGLTIMADNYTIVYVIKNLKASATVKASGSFTMSLLRNINDALKELAKNNDSVLVGLDLSEVTGLTALENASSSSPSNSFYGCANLTGVILPNTLKSIGDGAFCGNTGLKSVTIPDSVTWIGGSAFSGCAALMSVAIPSVTRIGDSAFSGCARLTSVTIPGSVTYIGWEAFNKCTALTSVTIPGSVTYIGSGAFNKCTALDELFYSGTLAQWCGVDFYAYSDSFKKLYVQGVDIKSAKELVIPNGVKKIGAYAFYGCAGLTSVTIPSSVTRIDSYAFYKCTALDELFYSGTLAQWCGVDFYAYYGSFKKLYVQGVDIKSAKELIIPNGVKKIGAYAFYGCAELASVTIGNGVTQIGDYAFYGCTELASVTIGSGATQIGNLAFLECTSLASVTIPDSVTSIGNGAFSLCAGLTSVTIGNGVTQIGESAFYGCTRLPSVTIPDSVTKVGDGVFFGCTNLTSVTFSDPNKWFYTSNDNFIGGTAIDSSTLADPATAATYLKDTYKYHYLYKL